MTDNEALAIRRKHFLAVKRNLREATTQFETILAWVDFGAVSQDYIEALEAQLADALDRAKRCEEPNL